MKNILLTAALLLMAFVSFSQSSYSDNNPANNNPLGYIGWNDPNNTNLNVLQNNLLRMRFTSIPYAPVGGIPDGQTQNYTSASRILLDVQGAGNPNAVNPYSILHLHGSSSVSGLQRNWMHVGTTYTDEGDILHVGIQQRPDNGPGDRRIDAVMAWGCNDVAPNGPDNLRFVFLRPLAENSEDPTEQEIGMEVGRFSPQGNLELETSLPTV